MLWKEIFPSDRQPSMDQISEYIGGEAKDLWLSLLEYMDKEYNIKPKLTYSICAGKPGWNIKLQKSGQTFGTLYPEENSFSVLIVISYKLAPEMEAIIPKLSTDTAELYKNAGDYMKVGKWMMLNVTDLIGLEDYINIVSVKSQIKSRK